MLNILRKSMANNGGYSSTHRHDAVEDLTAWELVTPSLSDDEDLYSFNSDDAISDCDDSIGGETEEDHNGEEDLRDVSHLDDVISMQSLSVSPQPVVCFPVEDVIGLHVYDDDDAGDEEEDGGMDDDDDDDDVDDELIPWKLKDRFGKQRIRKMGKRGGPKVSKSKRLPHYHNRPGCLYGKHGLGVQHYYI
ncbi:uncharacterized protein [Primulina eburnea]|uniref:uncharacterized protein n=1 Tax=Primulina eburnea TaxID=1245227 RepID=UPI003C6C080A